MIELTGSPLKNISNTLSPSQHRTLSAYIFGGSSQKSSKTRYAEKRYSKPTQAFDKIDLCENPEEPKTGKLLTFNEAANLSSKTKHRRKSSIDEISSIQEKKVGPYKALIKHSRNVSDADSVIYKQTEEDIKRYSKVTASLKNSLPTLEGTPCTIYCRYCQRQVHSQVDIYSSSVSKKLLNVFSTIISCCQVPTWLNDMKVHRCPNCSLVLARVGIINSQ